MGITFAMKDRFSKAAFSAGKSIYALNHAVKKLAMRAGQVNNLAFAMSGLESTFNDAIAPGLKFNETVTELQAITGATKEELDLISDSARKLAVRFGTSAAANVESFTAILSRLGPQIAQTPEALAMMGENVNLLAKTMGNDAVGAMDALTTAMLQYNVDLSDPMQASRDMKEIMDQMTAGAVAGAAEVPELAQTLAVAGGSASMAGIKFGEFVAATEALALGSMKGSEAGTGLRNVIGKLQEGRFLPPRTQEELRAAGVNLEMLADNSISLGEKMMELRKIQKDAALVTKFFGVENQRAAQNLILHAEQLDPNRSGSFADSINKSTGSTQQFADTIMGSVQESINRFQARVEDLGISFFNAVQGAVPMMHMLFSMSSSLLMLAPVVASVKDLGLGLITSMRGAAVSVLGMGGASVTATPALLGFAAAAWAAVAPLLPFIALGAAVVATAVGVWKAIQSADEKVAAFGVALAWLTGPIGWTVGAIATMKRGWEEFTAVMEGGDVGRGIVLFFQRVGGVLQGVVRIFQTATDEGWTFTQEMNTALERLGILDFVTALGTWIVRLKAFFGGLFTGVMEGLNPIRHALGVFMEALAPLGELFGDVFGMLANIVGELGLSIGKASGEVSGFRKAGEIAGKVLMWPFQALGWVLTAIARTLQGLVYGFTVVARAALSFGGLIVGAFMAARNGATAFFDYVGSLPSMVYDIGVKFVQGIHNGILAGWANLKTSLLSLIGDLPGGSMILEALGVGSSASVESAAAGAVNAAAEGTSQFAAASAGGTNTVRETNTTTREIVGNINLVAEIDGETVARKVTERQSLEDSRA